MIEKMLDPAEEKRIQRIVFHDRVKVLHDHLLTLSVPATILCASVLFAGLYSVENKSLLIAWYSSVIVISFLRVYLLYLYRRTPTNDHLHLKLFIFSSTLAALTWGIAGTVLMPVNNISEHILTIVIIAGVTAGASQTLQASRAANMLFMITAILPLTLWLMLGKQHVYMILSIAVLGYLAVMLQLAQKGYLQVTESMRLRHMNVFLLKQLSETNHDLRNEITERQKTQVKLNYIATHDALTKIPNRHSFDTHFNTIIERAQSHTAKFNVLFLDVDHFKFINDTYGHDTGDMLLYRVVMRLKKNLRANDMIVRMGGDEFIILVEDLHGEKYVEKFTVRINNLFKKPLYINGHTLFITLSIGVSSYPDDGEDKNILLKKADMALYRAKERGRNRTEFYQPTQ